MVVGCVASKPLVLVLKADDASQRGNEVCGRLPAPRLSYSQTVTSFQKYWNSRSLNRCGQSVVTSLQSRPQALKAERGAKAKRGGMKRELVQNILKFETLTAANNTRRNYILSKTRNSSDVHKRSWPCSSELNAQPSQNKSHNFPCS